MEMKQIEITVTALVPANATDDEITEWVDVKFGECNSMDADNPCESNYEIEQASWSPEY